MKKFLHILTLAFVVLMASVDSSAAGKLYSIKASLDSAVILMGNRTAVKVELVGNLDGSGYFLQNDSLWKDVEISNRGDVEINDLGNGRKELKEEILIQAFDSGLYSLPPITYVQGRDTLTANQLTLKVIPVNVDTLQTIHDYAGVVSPGRKFFDFVPDWISDYGIWILLAFAVAMLGYFLWKEWKKKGRLPLVPVKKELPPYEKAMLELQRLRGEHLCEVGKEKEYYTRLTEILRVYLFKRFGINAMEMTSGQIVKALRSNDSTKLSEPLMARILETADFVKFAKSRPLPDDNVEAFSSAVDFLEQTKPEENPEEADDEESTDKK